MNKILNITNGDFAVDIMKTADIKGDFLPWRDVLHSGPVPNGLSFEELSKVRAKYITAQGWGSKEAVEESFTERAEIMNGIEHYDKVILWFEHDLYDQLQMLEILHWFATHTYNVTLSIICTNNYLGQCSAEQMKSLLVHEESVTDKQLHLATKAWEAFTSNTPKKWAMLGKEDTSLLPFLKSSILRFLEEYPACKNGLSKIQQDVLEIVDEGEYRIGRIFEEQQKREEAIFLGDTVFVDIINELIETTVPLLNTSTRKSIVLPFLEQEVFLTTEGKKMLLGEKLCSMKNSIDKWLGGVHINKENYWCWDGETIRNE